MEAPSRATVSSWIDTVGPAVRSRSVKLLAELLHGEADKAAEIANDLGLLAGELLAIGDYASSAAAAEALAGALAKDSAFAASCRASLDRLADSHVLQDSLQHGNLDAPARAALLRVHRALEQRGLARNEDRHAAGQLRDLREHMQRTVTTDPLTQALSGLGLRQALETELRRTRRTGAHPVAMLLDCDGFKQINQHWGHTVGDLVLAEVARRIREVLRSSDHVARVGTDEFLMILPETGYWEALRIADRLRMKTNAPVQLGTADPLNVATSIGVFVIPTVAASLEQVLELAHAALAKTRAGKRVSGHGGAETTIAERVASLLLQEETYHSVREPIVRLADDDVSRYELLSRTTIAGFEMPADFLEMAFSRNIVSIVDRLCLNACLSNAAANRDPSVIHHVNLFPSTILTTPPESLVDALSVVPRERLCIEITEQQFVGDARHLKHRLAVLRHAGVRVALDDVGFGRTSLELLILLEPDIVKIDRRFVKGVSTDPLQAASFRRLVEVVNALGAEIVAEGIETPDDRRAVQQFGVRYGQGFLWRSQGTASPAASTV